jgi:hypothetical protein
MIFTQSPHDSTESVREMRVDTSMIKYDVMRCA